MQISPVAGIGPAMGRTGLLLFQPFRFKKWLALALMAAMTLLGQGGGSGFNGNFGGRSGAAPGAPAQNFSQAVQEGIKWIGDNLTIIIVVGLIVILLGLCFYLLARWLSSRGHFMFIDNIVNNTDHVKAPWANYKSLGMSFFRFRLVWDLILFNIYLLLLVIVGILIWHDFKQGMIAGDYPFTAWTIWAIVVFVGGLLFTLPIWWLLHSVITHMVIPVMYIRQIDAWPAFKETWRELLWPNKGACLLFFLMMSVTGIVTAIWSFITNMLFIVVTCCTGALIMIIPFVGIYVIALMALPPLIFARAYSLHFVEQFGPQYAIAWQTPVREGGFPVVMPPVPPTTNDLPPTPGTGGA